MCTGVNQTAGKLQLERMDQMAEQGFGNFVEVSAHTGARSDGSGGAADHAAWQGKVYHRGGRIYHQGEWYEDFEAATGYGTGEGLCGWNCRHNFHPFWPGISKRNYTDEQLAAMNEANVPYNGKLYTRYEINQMQRALERKVRSAKRKYLAESAAGVDASRSAVRLKAARQQLNKFIRATGGRADSSRTSVAGFGRSEASKATWSAQKKHTEWIKSINAQDSEFKSLAKYYEAKYNNSPAYRLLHQYAEDVESGWVSPLSGFSNYRTLYNRIQNEIVGKTAANGTVITGQVPHFMQRVIGTLVDPKKLKEDLQIIRRSGVSVEDIKDALFSPQKTGKILLQKNGKRSIKLYGEKCAVAINPDTGMLIQTNPRGSE